MSSKNILIIIFSKKDYNDQLLLRSNKVNYYFETCIFYLNIIKCTTDNYSSKYDKNFMSLYIIIYKGNKINSYILFIKIFNQISVGG